jgi:hypothetical protein
MYRLFYAERDTSLLERFPEQNVGIDQILELTKNQSGSIVGGKYRNLTYNSRILIDFGSEIDTLSTAITAGQIPALGNSEGSASVYLSLRSSDATDLIQEYTLKAFPVSQSWNNGQGYANDDPKTTDGASWFYRNSKRQATYWSQVNDQPAAAYKNIGGGSFITGSTYEASQSFKNEVPDIRMNVTDIVDNWVKGNITNYGFLVKRPESDEKSAESLGSIKFFSRETHTMFVPKLEVVWNDTTFASTASAEISADSYVPYIKNIKDEYRTSEIAKFRIGVRPEFPDRTYTTTSFYLTGERLPTSSYYSIIDSVTNETMIEYDTAGTQIDCDANGSFFRLRMDSFMPERYYKIQLKVERDGGNDIQTFDDFYFKVVN